MYGKGEGCHRNRYRWRQARFPLDKWVHLRKSNTEPIIRVYSEALPWSRLDELGKKLMQVVYDMQ